MGTRPQQVHYEFPRMRVALGRSPTVLAYLPVRHDHRHTEERRDVRDVKPLEGSRKQPGRDSRPFQEGDSFVRCHHVLVV